MQAKGRRNKKKLFRLLHFVLDRFQWTRGFVDLDLGQSVYVAKLELHQSCTYLYMLD